MRHCLLPHPPVSFIHYSLFQISVYNKAHVRGYAYYQADEPATRNNQTIMNDISNNTGSRTHPRNNSFFQKHGTTLVILSMIAAFLLIVLCRQEIRVRWWGYKLANSTEASERLFYLQLLAESGAKAIPVAKNLLAENDAGLRSFGLALSASSPGEPAVKLLIKTCDDTDWEIRKGAITALAMRKSESGLQKLLKLTANKNLETAMLAVSHLANTDSPAALESLKNLALNDKRAGVRAQAIESLAYWPVDDIAEALISCLSDQEIYEGLIASDQEALDILSQASPDLAAEVTPEQFSPSRTNGTRAAIILQKLIGQNFGYIETPTNDKSTPVKAWKNWWEKQHPGS